MANKLLEELKIAYHLADQVLRDIEAIEKEWFGEGKVFAVWSSPAHTKRWCEKLKKKWANLIEEDKNKS